MEIEMNLWELEEETQEICLKLQLNVKTEEFLIPRRNRKQVFSKMKIWPQTVNEDLHFIVRVLIETESLKTLEFALSNNLKEWDDFPHPPR